MLTFKQFVKEIHELFVRGDSVDILHLFHEKLVRVHRGTRVTVNVNAAGGGL